MPKKKQLTKYDNTVIENEDFVEPKLEKTYTFPAYGVSVRASSYEEAITKLNIEIYD